MTPWYFTAGLRGGICYEELAEWIVRQPEEVKAHPWLSELPPNKITYRVRQIRELTLIEAQHIADLVWAHRQISSLLYRAEVDSWFVPREHCPSREAVERAMATLRQIEDQVVAIDNTHVVEARPCLRHPIDRQCLPGITCCQKEHRLDEPEQHDLILARHLGRHTKMERVPPRHDQPPFSLMFGGTIPAAYIKQTFERSEEDG
jgi:hypothetical protein